jgi:hypothetical protein
MNTVTSDNPLAWLPTHPAGVSLFGLPAERSAKRSLPGTADDVLRAISSILDGMLMEVIAHRTASEFTEAVHEAMPRYVNLVLAFAKLATAVVRPQTMQRLTHESFAELESDLRDHGLAVLGEPLRERGIFTVWTLRKTADLLTILEKAEDAQLGADKAQREKDGRLYQEFVAHALRSRFHIDCLIVSMRSKRPIYPEVVPLVDDGLRSAVNAYAWIKQAVDLRFPVDESEPMTDYWTEEDKELVDASMRDLAHYDVE